MLAVASYAIISGRNADLIFPVFLRSGYRVCARIEHIHFTSTWCDVVVAAAAADDDHDDDDNGDDAQHAIATRQQQ